MTVVIGLAIVACAGFIAGGFWQWCAAREVLADAAEYAEELEISVGYLRARASGRSHVEAQAIANWAENGRRWEADQ